MKRTGYVPTLDGWRAVAILLVLGQHAKPWVGSFDPAPPGAVLYALGRGNLGVDIFFTLSGFLIGTLLVRERERSGRVAVGGFLARRAIRILPALWAYLAIVGLLAAVRALPGVTTFEGIASVLFCRNYVAGSWYTGHTWSLCVEVHFYVLAPLLLATLRPGRAALVAAALSVGVAAGRAVEASTGWVQALAPDSLPIFRTENRLDVLLNGLLLALALGHPGVRAWLARHLTTGRTLALLAVATLALMASRGEALRISLLVPLVVAHTVLRPGAILGRFLETRPLRWVGLISYSLYLWQQLLLPPLAQKAPGPLGAVQQSIWSLPLAFLLATASLRLVELPMSELGRRWTGAKPALPNLGQRAVDLAAG